MSTLAFTTFMAEVDKLTAPTHNMFGTSTGGLGLNMSVLQGGRATGDDLGLQLNRQAVAFGAGYRRSDARLPQLAADLEGTLLMLQTMGVITQPHAESLIGQLHDLVSPDGQRRD